MRFFTLYLCCFFVLSCRVIGSDFLPLIPYPKGLEILKGRCEITVNTRIVYNDISILPAAEALAQDIHRVSGMKLSVFQGGDYSKGDIVILLDNKSSLGSGGYYLKSQDVIGVQAANLEGIYSGTVTLLQLLAASEDKKSVLSCRIKDKPDKGFRAHMIDIKNQWHSVEDIKNIIDMCRWYKIRYISLHTGDNQWIGALLDQINNLNAQDKDELKLYSKSEMEDLITYGKKRGVSLLPHNECTPSSQHMLDSMRKDYNLSDKYAGFADEVDGLGSYSNYEGKNEERWMNMMELIIGMAIDQFAKGYSDGFLPYYHIGPVEGEGGMSDELALKIVEIINRKSPNTKIMFWNGIHARNSKLWSVREKCVVVYYDDEFGKSSMEDYLREGWSVVNSAWSPLYVVGSNLARSVESVYKDWNLLRQGSDGIPGGYGAVDWEYVRGEKLVNKGGIIGGMLATWEVPLQYHLERVRVRVPAMMEHIWNYKPWPYDNEGFIDFEQRLLESNKLLSNYLNKKKELPLAPVAVKASIGGTRECVKLDWRSGGGGSVGFRVMRKSISTQGKEEQISPDLPITKERFIDTTAKVDMKYEYWVVAFNSEGVSPPSAKVTGIAGSGVAGIQSYEPFDYESSFKGISGFGWESSWVANPEKSNVAKIGLHPKGLSYKGLKTSGGALRVFSKDEKVGVSGVRKISGKIGVDDTKMWMSYLIKPLQVGNGDMFVMPNSKDSASIGKVWGKRFSIYRSSSNIEMEKDQIYFVVALYDFGEVDNIHMWVNPSLNREPKIENANQSVVSEIGYDDSLKIRMQGYGSGDYLIDEIRLGETWQSVGGVINPTDRQSPTPSVMTWIAPPSQLKDGAVYMRSVEAEDKSGVEYLFECIDTKHSSGWQTSNSYSISTFKKGNYRFRVRSRDLSHNKNESRWSSPFKITVK